MANYKFNVYDINYVLNNSITNVTNYTIPATVPSTWVQRITITDDDDTFNDSDTGPLDTGTITETILANAYKGDGTTVLWVAGERVVSGIRQKIVNHTTGETGYIYQLVDDNSGYTNRGIVSTITLHPGDRISTSELSVDGHFKYGEADGAPPCFVSGTLIETSSGPKPVDQIEIGDLVRTQDNGMQEVRWIGGTTVKATGNMAPVVFKKDAIGNTRELRVSQNHSMLVSNWRAEVLFGEAEVFSLAKNMINGDNIYIEEGGDVSYHHIMFDQHQIVFSENVASESFYPGKVALSLLEVQQRDELLKLFPELSDVYLQYGEPARMVISATDARLMQAF